MGPSGNAVTTVSTLDPIKANFTVSEQEYLSLTRSKNAFNQLQLEMVLSDGSIYPQKHTAMAGVSNVGLDTAWTGHHFAQANWYAFGRLAWNVDLSSEQIAD